MQDKYIIVKYLRLSCEDGDKTESDSIANQRHLLDFHISKEFADRNIETIELIDDGYSGTNMNRPGIKKLLILAETHSIDCVIVKDFSRFARDYIEVGRYAEQKFPEWEIRFISVNDKYDSRDYKGITGGIDMALKNITYTLYSRDLSEKVKSARHIQYKMGKFLSPYAFFGYSKDPNNKGHIIVDEKAAEIVKRIFNMRLSGISVGNIAKQFNKEGILTPAQYKKSVDPLCREWNCVSNYNYWTTSIVGNILRDERYTGKMISLKHERITVGSTKVKGVKKEDRIVAENTHEAIISQELFDAVRAQTHRSISKIPAKIGLRGLVRCGGCHHRMTYQGKDGQNIKYSCSYKDYTEQNNCFCGKVYESELENIVIETIKSELVKAADNSVIEQKNDDKTKLLDEEIEKLNIKISEQKSKKMKDYISLTKNQLTEEQFQKRREVINDKIAEYKQQLEQLTHKKVSSESLSVTGIFDKYIGTDEINRETVEDLIKAIYVYPDKRIEIEWNIAETEY